MFRTVGVNEVVPMLWELPYVEHVIVLRTLGLKTQTFGALASLRKIPKLIPDFWQTLTKESSFEGLI